MKNNSINFFEKIFEEKGITLIALIVTIIVLIILAGISISILTGENGIITRVQNAKNTTNETENEEINMLNDVKNIYENLRVEN